MIDYFITNVYGRIVLAGQAKTEEEARMNVTEVGQQFHLLKYDGRSTHLVDGEQVDNRPAPTYVELRRDAYPALPVLADALYWQAKGDETKMQAYLAACAAVKEKYPK